MKYLNNNSPRLAQVPGPVFVTTLLHGITVFNATDNFKGLNKTSISYILDSIRFSFFILFLLFYLFKTELYRAKQISSNFTSEVTLIRNKFESAGYPKRFVNSIIREFNAIKENEESDFFIPLWLFGGKKKVVLVEILFCLKNEISSKHFIKKFNKFTNNTFDVRIIWLTQKVKNLFRVKDKSLHQA